VRRESGAETFAEEPEMHSENRVVLAVSLVLSAGNETSNFDPSDVVCFYRTYFALLYISFFQWNHLEHHIAAMDLTCRSFFQLASSSMMAPM